jgi:hypothetical protein
MFVNSLILSADNNLGYPCFGHWNIEEICLYFGACILLFQSDAGPFARVNNIRVLGFRPYCFKL